MHKYCLDAVLVSALLEWMCLGTGCPAAETGVDPMDLLNLQKDPYCSPQPRVCPSMELEKPRWRTVIFEKPLMWKVS